MSKTINLLLWSWKPGSKSSRITPSCLYVSQCCHFCILLLQAIYLSIPGHVCSCLYKLWVNACDHCYISYKYSYRQNSQIVSIRTVILCIKSSLGPFYLQGVYLYMHALQCNTSFFSKAMTGLCIPLLY